MSKGAGWCTDKYDRRSCEMQLRKRGEIMSEIKKDTDDFLMLLSGLTDQKDKVNEMYINTAKKSKAYRLIQQLNSYKFISPQAEEAVI